MPHLGADYLELLRSNLEHPKRERSERPDRTAKTSAERLTGEAHGHGPELLGCRRFARG